MGIVIETVVLALIITLVVLGAGAVALIKATVRLVEAIAEEAEPVLEKIWQELEGQWSEARKPQRIKEAGRDARRTMTKATDQFVAEAIEFLQEE